MVKDNYSLKDVCDILKITWSKARRMASMISTPVKSKNTIKYILSSAELFRISVETDTLENLNKYYETGEIEDAKEHRVEHSDNHPLVTDKRFLREDYFPDLKLSGDFGD